MARLLSPASLIALASFSLALPAFAQTATENAPPPPNPGPAPVAADTGMSAFQFSGVINADNIYVRSGSSVNDYPVLRLNKGDPVVVVGQKMEWLKILPPKDAFCLVGKLWVDARADGTVGRVHDDANNVNVRIGSKLNNMIATVVTTLNGGQEVKIIGSQDEYYQIAPPAGAFVYVNKRFVDVVKRVDVAAAGGTMEVKPAGEAAPTKTASADETATPAQAGGDTNSAAAGTVTPPAGGGDLSAAPTTGPSVATGGTAGSSVAPTTMPSAEAQAAFDSLEARFADASNKPIGDQPIDELLAGYTLLAADQQLPESMHRTADARVKALGIRHDLFGEFQKNQAEQAAADSKALPLVAEAAELRDRMKDEVKRYAAVGALHTSALPFNGTTLYRLTDPASGRTVVYVVTADPAIKAMEGQFVGLRGDLTDDATRKIRYITPTAAEPVEAADLAKGTVTSGLMPPSMMSAAASAGQ